MRCLAEDAHVPSHFDEAISRCGDATRNKITPPRLRSFAIDVVGNCSKCTEPYADKSTLNPPGVRIRRYNLKTIAEYLR